MNAKGIVHKYGDNVDTDVIIPARYLNSSEAAELAKHCMDIDLGGFIPCPDHRIAPDAKFELVQYYCELMRKL